METKNIKHAAYLLALSTRRIDMRKTADREIVDSLFGGDKELAEKELSAIHWLHLERVSTKRASEDASSFLEEAKRIKQRFGGTGSYAKRVIKSSTGSYYLASLVHGLTDYNKSLFAACKSDRQMKVWNAFLAS